MNNINEKGRSMVEMLGVLAIIGVLSAGGLAGYSKAMFKHKLNTTIDQITMIVTNIRTLYGTQGNYAGLNNGMAVKAGVVPNAMYTANSTGTYDSNATLTNPFKGGATIAVATVATVDNAGFTVTYTNLPSEACVQIATSDFGTGAGSGFIGSAASNSASTAPSFTEAQDAGKADEGKPMTLANAIAACNGAGTVNQVSLKFY